jgi:hypothetical protein
MEGPHITRLLDAVGAEAARIAEAPVQLVSITFDWMAIPEGAASANVEITRATRTLVFSTAQLRDGARLVCTASAVHKIVE